MDKDELDNLSVLLDERDSYEDRCIKLMELYDKAQVRVRLLEECLYEIGKIASSMDY